MIDDRSDAQKGAVRDFWEETPCGTQFAHAETFTKEYFDEIEEHRYAVEPEIFSFAQFTRFNGAHVLEVGVGAGTDFCQWVRAGAHAVGVDLTENGVATTKQRLSAYGLAAEGIRVADAEKLPFEDGTFDLVYSWGVIHHSPDTVGALREIVRVCKPGGRMKVMVYHRRSLVAFALWVRTALRSGRPDRSLAWVLANYMESPGTTGYTVKEIRSMFGGAGVTQVNARTSLSHYDVRGIDRTWLRAIARPIAWLLGDRVGWWLLIDAVKPLGENGQLEC